MPVNIRASWKGFTGTNPLAYFGSLLVMKKTNFYDVDISSLLAILATLELVWFGLLKTNDDIDNEVQ